MTRQRKAVFSAHLEEMVEKLEFILRSLCGQIEELAELQHHRRWCIDSVFNLSPELQNTYHLRGFNVLATFNYMMDCRKIYEHIDIDPNDILKLYALNVRNLSIVDGKVSEEVTDLLKYYNCIIYCIYLFIF